MNAVSLHRHIPGRFPAQTDASSIVGATLYVLRWSRTKGDVYLYLRRRPNLTRRVHGYTLVNT